jgi:hypothetical protein
VGVALAVESSPWDWRYTDKAKTIPESWPTYCQSSGVWIWGNTYQSIPHGEIAVVWGSDDYIKENRDYFLRAPSIDEDGFVYTPYTYPHPFQTNFPPVP